METETGNTNEAVKKETATIESMPNGEDKAGESSTVFGIDSSILSKLTKRALLCINFVNEKFDSLNDDQKILGLLGGATITVLLLGKWSALILSAAIALRIAQIMFNNAES